MEQIEKKSRKRSRKRDLKRVILTTIAVAGGISLVLVAPNVVGALAKMDLLPRPRDKESITRARRILQKEGLLCVNDGRLELTAKGAATLNKLQIEERGIPKPRKWDGRWRVLIFDIPERRKYQRDSARASLMSVGFKRIQDSVWIFPYECEEFVALLKADLRIGKNLLYLIVDSLEADAEYRTFFGLPKES